LRNSAHSILGLVSVLVLLGGSAFAETIDLIQVGTWTENPGNFQPSSGSELQLGGKFVIKTSYDPEATPSSPQQIGGETFHVIELSGGTAGPTGGSTANGNSFEVLVPMEGFDTGGVPFVYGQTATDHLNFPDDPYESPNTRIHFDAPGGDPADFVGYRFEGGSVPGALNNFIQIQTEISEIGTLDPLASQVVNIRFEENASSYPMVIRSVNGIEDALGVVAEAGPDLSYDAGTWLATTDGGTSQDNDLGAGRSDKEDFLTHTWSLAGSVESGAVNAPLVGDDVDRVRPDGRAVEKVNKTVEIASSGLRSTTDVATWKLGVTEDLTGLDGGTDTLTLSYENELPIVATALATPVGFEMLFELAVEDADLAINDLGLADFELLEVALYREGMLFTALADLLSSGSQLVDWRTLVDLFGLGDDRLEVRASDRVLREGGGTVNAFIDFTVIPEPGTAVLVLAGLAGTAIRGRSRGRV
jgi:hypothetical protein